MSYPELCALIEAEAPYGSDVDFDTDSAVKEGFGKDFDAANPSDMEANDLDDDQNRASVWIHIDGEFHRCPKAMIIPLTFTRGGNVINAHVIIGYTGPGV